MRALALLRKHGSIEGVLAALDPAKYALPDPFPYEEARRLFKGAGAWGCGGCGGGCRCVCGGGAGGWGAGGCGWLCKMDGACVCGGRGGGEAAGEELAPAGGGGGGGQAS